MMRGFHVIGFPDGVVVVFGGDDRPIPELAGQVTLWRWLRIWWRLGRGK
jgi:hypothetical protein